MDDPSWAPSSGASRPRIRCPPRRVNSTNLAAICQIRKPGTEGRIYFERKVAEGKTKKDAIRSLKRHVSNIVYRKLLDDHQNRAM